MSSGARLGWAALAAALGIVALPPWNVGWIAWLALVPLFVGLDGSRGRSVVVVAVAYAVLLIAGSQDPWLAPGGARYFETGLAWAIVYTLVPLTLLALLHGLALGVVLLARPRAAGPWDVIWCAAVWACWEGVRTFVFPYFPGPVLGLSQHAAVRVLQVASAGGIVAVSFVLVAFNVGLAALLSRARGGRRVLAAATGVALAASAVAWGAVRVGRGAAETPPPGPTLVAVDVKASRSTASTLERYLAASAEAAAARPALVVWPESALTADLERDRAVWGAVSGFVASTNVALLAGGPGSARRGGRQFTRFNSAHLLTPGHGMRSYHKRWLVPFAERWPWFLGRPPPDLAGLEEGTEATVFPLDDTAFGVLICFEIVDAGGARDLARAGARFVVNATNDAWFVGRVRPPHLAWAPVRAVETGLPVVRAANAGPSALFDRFGREVAASEPGDHATLLVARVPGAHPTFYARHGDVFLLACLGVVLAGVVAAWRRRR